MRRLLAITMLFSTLFVSHGCIAVSSKNMKIGVNREVVAVNGRVYMVDKRSGTACEIDLTNAEPFVAEDELSDDDD